MDFMKKYIPGRLKFDWKFLVKLSGSAVFTALGAYELGLNPELYVLILIVVPIAGLVFTYLKLVSDKRTIRIISIIVMAIVLGLWLKSFFLGIAFFLMLEGATQKNSVRRYDDAKWVQIAETNDSIDEANEMTYGHTLFQTLPVQERTNLSEKCKITELEPEETLIRQGEFNCYLYLIAKGSVDVISNGKKVASLGEGDVVGEISAIGLSLPTADVVATTKLLAFAFPIDDVNKAASENPGFAEQLHEIGMRRLHPRKTSKETS